MPAETGPGTNAPQAEQARQSAELPIMAFKDVIQKRIQDEDTVMLVGGTGTGKTVKTPQFIREMMKPGERLVVTEPRQINASTLAARVAEEMGETFGEKIGFRHGDDEKYSRDATDTIFETEGLLLQQAISDPELKNFNYVLIDEAHVRSENTEELLFAVKRAQRLRREKGDKPLKLIVTSATVNKEEFSKYLGGVTPIEVESKTNHPVEEHFEQKDIPQNELPQTAANKVKQIVSGGKGGDIMIFVASTSDITKTEAKIKELGISGLQTIALHRNSSEADKEEVQKTAADGARRVIIATNFAETGVTVNGLRHVIDTGYQIESTIHVGSGLTHTTRKKTSQAESIQRKGRVGRTEPGDYYALFTKADYDARQEFPTPEIQRTDLTNFVMFAKHANIDPANADMLSSPLNPNLLKYANDTLKTLGALNEDGSLNNIGERMLALSTEYHLARFIAEAESQGKGVAEACTIAALAESGIRMNDKMKNFRDENQNSDYIAYLNLWNEWNNRGQSEDFAKDYGLDLKMLQTATRRRKKIMDSAKVDSSESATNEELERMVATAYKDKVMGLAPDGTYRIRRQEDSDIVFDYKQDSSLAARREKPKLIVFHTNREIDDDDKGKVVDLEVVQRVEEEWLAA